MRNMGTMNDLISREAVLELLGEWKLQNTVTPYGAGYNAGMQDAIKAIQNLAIIPPADTEVHSRFVNMGGFPACERCGASPATWEPKPNNPSGYPPYCFNCGARMDKTEGAG